MKIEPTYTTLKQSKVLKEKGFDEECRMCVEDGDDRPLPFDCGRELHKNSLHPYYSAPEQWVVVEWLRVNHGIWVSVGVGSLFHGDKFFILIKKYNIDRWELTPLDNESHSPYDTPQEAYSAAFDYILTSNLI
jgi:hypothetical protein